MNILVTGARGFIAQNLIAELESRGTHKLLICARDTDPADLERYCQQAEYVFHLAGVNRPQDASQYMDGNYGFTSTLLQLLRKHNNACPIVLSSSIQAAQDNPYGLSKRASEDAVRTHVNEIGGRMLLYRLPNVFGKWCRPNYNSVVATFCYNIARELPLTINDPESVLNLVYIDDVVQELLAGLDGNENSVGDYCEVPVMHTVKLGTIVSLLESFRESRETRQIADMSDPFTKKLYSTYLSYLPEDQFSYKLKMNTDARGSFTEFIKTPERGQVSVNISKPGITKGNHWHHTKNEKFLVVSGTGVIRFRKIGSEEVLEYHVSGDKLEVVDIPTGYTHNIENLGDQDMVTIMWANEYYDPNRPDTYYLEV